jgi:anti-sigma-K factor RskA
MIEDEDIDGLAAEYVLGSLDAAERGAVEARRGTDRRLAQAIAAWERRLAPLSEREPGLAPPAHLLDGILAHIAGQGAQPARRTAEILPISRSSGRRWMAYVIGASAACAALAVIWFMFLHSETQTKQVARMDCSRSYKEFWENLDRDRYAAISPEQLAGLSRMALRAFDACQAGDEQDAKSLFDRLKGGKA